MSNQQSGSNRRSLTGLVTKIVGDGATYGFINDEIFFSQANVSGGPASVGDQVFAECEYSAHLPIKWNATSVKIIPKTAGQSQDGICRQDIQQPSQFNPITSVAPTYQQHRQQRQQQRQLLEVEQDSSTKQATLQHNTSSGEFDGTTSTRPFFNQQQPDSNIQPFRDQPMGPPNFTYTSQLGSAFVQNPAFVPTPFITHQPPPNLPQQHQQQQQHLNTNQMQGQNNHRHMNQNNRNNNNRYNNQGDKNDRFNNRRMMNRNEKFDRPRSGDRDNTQNNRSSRSRNSRDRSVGRNSKRDEPITRPSPPSQSSARSNSINSDKAAKSKRHYEARNIPKTRIMTNMDAFSMKQRCPTSIHVPSDLKDVIVNTHFRLDIKNIPKPLKYNIEQVETEAKPIEVIHQVESKQELPPIESKKDDGGDSVEKDDQSTAEEIKEENAQVSIETKIEIPSEEIATGSRSEFKLNHKYGVKVILLSLEELSTIYREVFGPDLDPYSSDNRSNSMLDETISLLCNKGSNNGYSLIGGKFDPSLDGFLDGEINESEKDGKHPNLIETCKRVVLESTGLDLSACRNWSLLSTFVYNNKSDYFSSKASVEYSFIYMPQIWTMLSEKFDREIINEMPVVNNPTNPIGEGNVATEPIQNETASADLQSDVCSVKQEVEKISQPIEESQILCVDKLSELKVTDLKAELDKRCLKYKGTAKKAELISMLQEHLRSLPSQAVEETGDVVTSNETKSDETMEVEKNPEQNFESESSKVDEDATNEQLADVNEAELKSAENPPTIDSLTDPQDSQSNNKRKLAEENEDLIETKKLCSDSLTKVKRVELVRDSFVVRARDAQQKLTLVSLFEVAQAGKHDQFELSVSANILKESLIQHLSEYIFTTLVEESKQKSISLSTSGNSSNSNSQETSNDSNNNSRSSSKNLSHEGKANLKELPVNRYIALALSYFDSSHMGYLLSNDLSKLFINTGNTISRRALVVLIGDGEKFNYKCLPDLPMKHSPTYVYRFPPQFSCILNRCQASTGDQNLTKSSKVIEFKGVTYEVDKLVQQVNETESLRISMVDRFNYAIENSDKQAEEIHVLEVSQKSLSKAIKAQNDEICDLKRERDSIKKKYDAIRKSIKGTIGSLSELVKDDK